MIDEFDVKCGVTKNQGADADNICSLVQKQLPSHIDCYNFKHLMLSNCSTDNGLLVFSNCRFDFVNIKNIDVKKIKKIRFCHCTIEHMHIYKCSAFIDSEKCDINEITLEQCGCQRFSVDGSHIRLLTFNSGDLIKKISVFDESKVEKIDCKDVKVGTVEICSSTVGFLHFNTSVSGIELRDASELLRFSIDSKEELKRFLNTMKKTKGTISERESLTRRHKQILLAAVTQYDEERKYQELDLCLLKLRRTNNYLRYLKSKHPLGKAACVFKEFVLGKMFGWGIALHNSIITFGSIIIFFACIYFALLRDKFDSVISCAGCSLYESVNRLFGIDNPNAITILPYFDNIEQIIGVIILTIFTGVLARKIIR